MRAPYIYMRDRVRQPLDVRCTGVGTLALPRAGRTGVADVVDVHVVFTAHRLGFEVITSDEDDLKPIADLLRPPVRLATV